MRLVDYKHFSGVNVHCFKPAVEAIVDLGELKDKETCDFPGFSQSLVKMLPGLKEHVCGIGKQGGFIIRLDKGTYFGHVAEHVAIEILSLAGYKSTYGKTRVMGDGNYKIVVQCHWPKAALEALEMAIDLVNDLVQGEASYPDIHKLERNLAREMPGPSTQSIIEAAKSRKIPVRMMEHGSLLRLGTGRYRQFVEATVTGKTSCIGVDMACDKTLTKRILSDALIPTPRGKIAGDEEDAVNIAKELGGTVVVKPCDGNQGKGVSLNLVSEAEVRAAYKVAENYSDKIIVEEQIFGRHYRILVVNNKVEAVSERFPAQVVGDGIHSIKELIDIENHNPLRGDEHEKPLTKIKVDQVVFNVLARKNLTMNYIPDPDDVIDLRDNANLSTGGTAADVTDLTHPENLELACRIARLLELDVAGVDVVTEDIAKPMLEGKGAIIEVNAAPGIRMHLFPSVGKRRPVGDAIVDYLFPWSKPHSIPLVSITGTNGKTTTSRLINHLFRNVGRKVGLTSTDGIFIDGICINRGDNTGPISADVVLSDPAVDVAVLETARGGLVKRGLGYDEADVAVVTNVSEDHLGTDGINTLEELAHVKSLIVETVSPKGYAVLNAQDKLVARMADKCPGKIIYFSRDSRDALLLRHIGAGGRGVFVKGQELVLAEGWDLQPVADLKEIPITFGGKAWYNVDNCLAAVGALWAMGVDAPSIADGLRTFDSSIHNPGRANLYDLGSFQVLIDYGHNIDGYKNILELMSGLEPKRKVGVIGVPGDRQDSDILAIGRLCGQEFDDIYIKEDSDLRDRQPGEVAQLLAKGVAEAGFSDYTIIHDEIEALSTAMKDHQEGDLVVIFYEELAPLQELVANFNSHGKKYNRKVKSTG